jgi:hypothetical protein
MNKISKAVAAAALTAVSVSANAWVGWGPYDGFGDGWADGHFSFHMGGGARSALYGYGYNAPYWGYPYYGYVSFVVPATGNDDVQEAVAAQQKQFAEQQAQAMKVAREVATQQAEAYRQAVEAQRKVAEQYAGQYPVVNDPLFTAHNGLMSRIVEDEIDAHKRFVSVHQDMAQRIVKDQTRFWDDVRDMHNGAFLVPVSFEERIKEAEERRAEAMKEAEERRAETVRMIEDQRAAVGRNHYRREI